MDKNNPMVIEVLNEKNRQPSVTYRQIAEVLGCSTMNVVKTYMGNMTAERKDILLRAIETARE